MFLLLCFTSFAVSLVAGAECDHEGIVIYEDLGCIPEYNSDKSCPVKFNCKGLNSLEKKCFFRGKSYTEGENVDSELGRSTCDMACFCRALDNDPSFICATVDCPEWLGVPLGENCYRNYSLDYCCSVGEICPPFDDNAKCVYEGKEYREGEIFFPPKTCMGCVCQKGFTGKLEEPFCKRRKCGHQLKTYGPKIRKSCGAFYSKELNKDALCCPDDWICPSGSEVFKGSSNSELECQFGDKKLKVGEYFMKENIVDGLGRNFKKVKCECAIPPLVKCIDV